MDQSLGALFSGKYVWTNGRESLSKVSSEIDIGPWMANMTGRGFHRTMEVIPARP